MRKELLVGLAALVIAIVPVAAQDAESTEVPESCTTDQITATNEAIGQLVDPFKEAAASTDPSKPETGTSALVAYQSLSTGFWNDVYPEIPDCIEASTLAYNFGLVLDESVIIMGLSRLAVYEAQYGDAEAAKSYLQYMQERGTRYLETVKNTFGQIAEDGTLPDSMYSYELPACTQEDLDAESVSGLIDSANAFKELAVAPTDDPNTLLLGLANLSETYWSKIAPELPQCTEIADNANNVGLFYNEALMISVLERVSTYEAEHGSKDAAAALNEGIEARKELMDGFVEAAFPDQAKTEE